MAVRRRSSKGNSGLSVRNPKRQGAEKIEIRDRKARNLASAVSSKPKKQKKQKRIVYDPDELSTKKLQEMVWTLEDQRAIREESYYPKEEAEEKWAGVVSAMVKKIQFLPNRFKSAYPDQVSSEMMNFLKRELLSLKQVAIKSLKDKK